MNNIINKKQVKYINTANKQIIIRFIDDEIIYLDYESENRANEAFESLTNALMFGSTGDLIIF